MIVDHPVIRSFAILPNFYVEQALAILVQQVASLSSPLRCELGFIACEDVAMVGFAS